MRHRLAGAMQFLRGAPSAPDLASQLEELLVEVWRQEDFERRHPFTCAVIRQDAGRPIHYLAG
jgi:hypothetical protein